MSSTRRTLTPPSRPVHASSPVLQSQQPNRRRSIPAGSEIEDIAALADAFDVDDHRRISSIPGYATRARTTHILAPAWIASMTASSPSWDSSKTEFAERLQARHRLLDRPAIVERMEKLQAIAPPRAAGYNQAVLRSWFSEPTDGCRERIQQHQSGSAMIFCVFRNAGLAHAHAAGRAATCFPTLPPLAASLQDFVRPLRRQANVVVTPGTEFVHIPTAFA